VFDGLLESLDGDRERAGEQYERLRKQLLRFFEWRGSPAPDESADETLNRVARRIAGGERISNVPAYALGVARMVFLETTRAQRRMRLVPVELVRLAAQESSELVEARAREVELGLARLSPEDRQLILDYYGDGTPAGAGDRKALARKLNISMNALRLRAFRIRGELERSMTLHCSSLDLTRTAR
jgi:DNA-directed RNA polymerase specialized sigma24 family protein